jgi:hypothetical protein
MMTTKGKNCINPPGAAGFAAVVAAPWANAELIMDGISQ